MFSKLTKLATATAVGAAMMAGTAWAETVIRVQSVIPSSADEIVMLKDFAEDVKALTEGEVVIEVLPAGLAAPSSHTNSSPEVIVNSRSMVCVPL